MAERTVEAYVTAVAALAQHYHRSPERLTDQELQDYLLYLRQDRHLAPSSLNQAVSAFRRFFDLVLHRPTDQMERLSSTTTYLHVREERLAQIQSPLQLLQLPAASG
jgi:hypothetical protein